MTEKGKRGEQEKAPQDALREEILADARLQAERLLRRARRDAKTLMEKAEAELDGWRNEQLEQARAEATRREELTRAGIPLERGRMRANRIEALLQEFYEDLRKSCANREGLDIRETVIALSAEAIRGMDGQSFVIEVPACDQEMLGPDWLDEVSRKVESPNLELEASYAEERSDIGPVVRDAAGRQAWDNRLVARLDRQWPNLRCEVAESLALRESLTPKETSS